VTSHRTATVIHSTWSGQALTLPQGAVELKANHVVMPVGFALAPHKHPYPRYVFIKSGRLSVSNEATGATREFGPGEVLVGHEACLGRSSPWLGDGLGC